MTRSDKQSLIRKAVSYNEKARQMASCNHLYMGSMATAMLFGALGKQYGRDNLAVAIEEATDAQLDAGLASCQNIIHHGKLVP